MSNLNCGDCPYQFREGVIFDCRECIDDDTCENWEADPTEEELEAQQTDAAERETHRREVEGVDLA